MGGKSLALRRGQVLPGKVVVHVEQPVVRGVEAMPDEQLLEPEHRLWPGRSRTKEGDGKLGIYFLSLLATTQSFV